MVILKAGAVVMGIGILANLFSGGGAEKADVLSLVQNGARVIDVRTAGEFSGGHIKGAINIPYDVIVREIGKVETDKEKAIVVYCRSGSRSSAAKKSLQQAGYTQVVNGGSLSRMKKFLKELKSESEKQ
jgi:phage shock protein E